MLYKKDENGKVRIWDVEVKDGKYRTITGQQDGKQITSKWTICEGKNMGRSNATDAKAQAIAEAKAMITKKKKRGYVESLADIDEVLAIKPMLAHKWEDHHHKIYWGIHEYNYSQPKLDGIRCIINSEGMWTRKGEKITTCGHISSRLINFVMKYNVAFDGELYNHEFKDNFNKIASLVRKQKVTPAQQQEASNYIEYHIYDIIPQTNLAKWPFSRRAEFLELIQGQLLDHKVQVVRTNYCGTLENLDHLYGQYLADGYEGQMIRTNKPYQFKRTDALLKRKEFVDDEFKILGIIEGKGNRSGQAGALCFRTKRGKEFTASVMGSDSFRKRLWETPKEFIGLYATVKYFHLTPDGSPRFPVVKSINEDK